MSLPTWIWYYGDFEIRQRLLVDSRRFGHDWFYAAPFCLDDCRHNVLFERSVTLKREERVFIRLDVKGDSTHDICWNYEKD